MTIDLQTITDTLPTISNNSQGRPPTGDIKDILLRGGHQLHDMIKYIKRAGVPVKVMLEDELPPGSNDLTMAFRPAVTSLGLCYTMINPGTLYQAGPLAGIQLLTDVQEEEYLLTFLGYTAGFTVSKLQYQNLYNL